MTADHVAAAVADLVAQRHMDTMRGDPPLIANMLGAESFRDLERASLDHARDEGVVVDIGSVLATFTESVSPYDQVMLPVWSSALIGYHRHADDVTGEWVTRVGIAQCFTPDQVDQRAQWESKDPEDHTFTWAEVAHVHRLLEYVFSPQTPRGRGPVCLTQCAVTPEGQVLDMMWTDIEPGTHLRSNLAVVWMMTLDLLACRNVSVREPHRDRATARRVARALPGTRVSELAITRSGAWTRGRMGDAMPIDATPLHTVRGHFAEYGANGKGLLFGRIAGRFFIPQHARGSAEHGRTEQHVTVDAS